MDKYRGIFPALVTPYDKNGKVNEKSLSEIINLNIERGVTGFYVNGSSSETFLLTLEEKKQLIDIVAEVVRGRKTVIYHVGSISTSEAIELARYGAKLNIDGISALPPFYYKFSFSEIKSYYQDIMNSVELPMIVYNIPALCGVQFTVEQFCELLADERIIGVKHTSINLYELERFQYHTNKFILSGYDDIFLGGLSMGAIGAIGTTFNLMADKYIAIQKYFTERNHEKAFALQREVNHVLEVLGNVGLSQGVKYGLEKLGIECNGCRKPNKELSAEDKVKLDRVFEKSQVL
jgi:N-acetylneuraminate lyase